VVKKRLHGGRIAALLMAVAGAGFMLTASQSAWVRITSPVGGSVGYGGIGLNMDLNQAGGLQEGDAAILAKLALLTSLAAVVALLPFLRIAGLAVGVQGLLAVGAGWLSLWAIRHPHDAGGVLDDIGRALVRQSPGPGPYLLIIGGGLAALSGLLTLLTPRRTFAVVPMPGARTHHQAPPLAA
jgi:hypothetical protein